MHTETMIVDSGSQFRIDALTKEIKNTSNAKITIMQGDHKSERFTFNMPRFIEGHDMTLCNRVEVHFTNTDTTTKEEKPGVYEVIDMAVDPADDTQAICTWLIAQQATRLAGTLKFNLSFKCEVNGVTEYIWNTKEFTGIDVERRSDCSGIVDDHDYLQSQIDANSEKTSKNKEAINAIPEWVAEVMSTKECFDGQLHYLGDADKVTCSVDSPNLGIYKIGKNYNGERVGILLVSMETDTVDNITTITRIGQTFMSAQGDITSRQALNWDSETGTVYTWSEWEELYATTSEVADCVKNTEFATNSPGSGKYGQPGIVRLGHMQGFKMVDNALVLDAATVSTIKSKTSSLLPIPPVLMAYAVALATHQQIGDDYNVDEFAVVGESKQNNESYYFPLDKDSLPVSYRAVKEAISDIDTSIYEAFNVVEVRGIGGRAYDGLTIMVHPDEVEKFTLTECVYLLNDGVYHKLKTSDFYYQGVVGDGSNLAVDQNNNEYKGWTYYWYNNADFNCNENTNFSLPLYYKTNTAAMMARIKALEAKIAVLEA